MLMQGTHGPLNDDQRRALAAVLRNAERLEAELKRLAEDLSAEAGDPDSDQS